MATSESKIVKRLDGTMSMRGLATETLQLYDGPTTGSSQQRGLDVHASGFTASERDHAEWLACQETWRPYPPHRPTVSHVPYSLAWFQEIEHRRYSRHGRWIPKFFEFNRHRGEQVLGLGMGLGTDWVQFALKGANVRFCSPSLEQVALTQRHFELRGLPGEFRRSPLAALPYDDNSMDVVCLSGLAGEVAALESVVAEVFRVLKPGGKVLAALPAYFNARYWQDFWFPWRRWLRKRTSDQGALFNGRDMKRLFERFNERSIYQRHLRRSDIPHVWRWILLPILQRIMGRYLVVKAFKPLVAAIPVRAAA